MGRVSNSRRDYNQHRNNDWQSRNAQNKNNKDYSNNEKNQNHTIPKDHFNMESDYVSEAEEIIKSLDKKLVTVKGKRIDTYKLTTTQIRKLLSLINEIYADILCDSEADKEEQDKKLRDKLLYLKPFDKYNNIKYQLINLEIMKISILDLERKLLSNINFETTYVLPYDFFLFFS